MGVGCVMKAVSDLLLVNVVLKGMEVRVEAKVKDFWLNLLVLVA